MLNDSEIEVSSKGVTLLGRYTVTGATIRAVFKAMGTDVVKYLETVPAGIIERDGDRTLYRLLNKANPTKGLAYEACIAHCALIEKAVRQWEAKNSQIPGAAVAMDFDREGNILQPTDPKRAGGGSFAAPTAPLGSAVGDRLKDREGVFVCPSFARASAKAATDPVPGLPGMYRWTVVRTYSFGGGEATKRVECLYCGADF